MKGEGFIYRPKGSEMEGQDARKENCLRRARMQREESTWIVLLQSFSLVTSVSRGLGRKEGQDRWLEEFMREEKWG